jgi:carboxymethylenebutenolidase
MIEALVDVTTADGAMETFICRPERGGPYPAVFFLMDAHGIREELRDMARRLARLATTCCCPTCITARGGIRSLGQTSVRRGARSTHACALYAPR